MRLLFIGFGTVAQGLSELLIEKKQELEERYGLDWKVTGIVDMLKGSACDPDGLDLEKVMAMVAEGKSISEYPDGGCDWDALTMIAKAEADAMIEVTYTDIKTGQPATDHIRAALARGLHVTTTNKGPLALFSNELADLAGVQRRRVPVRGHRDGGDPAPQPPERDPRRFRNLRDEGHPQRHHQLHPDPDGSRDGLRGRPQTGPGTRLRRGGARRRRARVGRAGQGDHPRQHGFRRFALPRRHAVYGNHRNHLRNRSPLRPPTGNATS